MTFAPCKRATLLIPSGPANDPNRHHLFILLTDPNEEGQVLLATFCSVRSGQFVAHDLADQTLLARIAKGLFDSPHAKPLHRAFYLACH